VKLLFFLAACRENGAAEVTAVVPYLAYARKDRQTKRRDPVTTRYVAQLFEAAGADRVITVDVHNVAAFQNAFRCRTVHLEARSAFVPRIRALAGGLPVTILSPDGGGVKRAELLRARYEAATGDSMGFGFMEKRRSRGVVSGELFAGEVAGAAVFIADDMISTGGTMRRAAEACRSRGAEAVFAMATHGLFGPGSDAMLADPAIDRILVSNSLPTATAAAQRSARIEIVSVAPLLGEAIHRLHTGSPLGDTTSLED
jgi:ribose-phosphate pyrophosphokinase